MRGVVTYAPAVVYVMTTAATSYFVTTHARNVPSGAVLFRNLRWLEREVSEQFSVRFDGQRDARSFALIPLIMSAPGRRAFPTCGFYEVFYAPTHGRLCFRHVSLAA